MRKNGWTADENKVLSDTILHAIDNNKSIGESFEQAAFLIDRSAKACEHQWSRIKKEYMITENRLVTTPAYAKAGDSVSIQLELDTQIIDDLLRDDVQPNKKESYLSQARQLIERAEKEVEGLSSIREEYIASLEKENDELKRQLIKYKELDVIISQFKKAS